MTETVAPSALVRSSLSDHIPEFVEPQNSFPSGNNDVLSVKGLPDAPVNPYAEKAKPLNLNTENWVTGSEWKSKINQKSTYPAG